MIGILDQGEDLRFTGLCLNPRGKGHILRTNWLTAPVSFHVHMHTFDRHAAFGRFTEEIIAIASADGK